MNSEEYDGGFCVREMTAADIRAVARLEAETFSQPWSEQGFESALKQPANIFVVAETDDGTIAAYCGLYASDEEGDITNVAVSAAMRRRGIGLAVVGEVLRRARLQGIRRVFLEVRASNVGAQSLYGKCGFAPCGVRRGFYRKPAEDAVLMRAELM